MTVRVIPEENTTVASSTARIARLPGVESTNALVQGSEPPCVETPVGGPSSRQKLEGPEPSANTSLQILGTPTSHVLEKVLSSAQRSLVQGHKQANSPSTCAAFSEKVAQIEAQVPNAPWTTAETAPKDVPMPCAGPTTLSFQLGTVGEYQSNRSSEEEGPA